MGSRALAVAVLVLLQVGLVSAPLRAQPKTEQGVSEDEKSEARWRFDRGIELYNGGDYTGALIEFQRAYKLIQNDTVRFNIGLVHAKLDDSVQVIDALTPLLEAPATTLDAARRKRVQDIYAEHSQRIGMLQIETAVQDAVIRVDNVDVARAPAPPLSVNAGSHVVAVLAPGYEPRRLSVSVAGRAQERVVVELMPLEEQYAQLTIRTAMPEVSVFDGTELVGVTPFATSIAFKPGVHDLTFRRAGYREALRTVRLHPGSTGELDMTMQIEEGAADLGVLSLGIEEEHAVVWVDGQPRMDHAGGLRLPVGRHHLRVQRSGFHDLERDVTVQRAATRVEVELFPTAEFLADYVDGARTRRTIAWIVSGAGVVSVIGGGAFLLWNQSEKDHAKLRFDRLGDEVEAGTTGMCQSDGCELELEQRLAELEDARDRDLWGWLGVGLGGAALTTGIVLYATGNDPERYSPSGAHDVFGSLRLHVAPGGAALRGRF